MDRGEAVDCAIRLAIQAGKVVIALKRGRFTPTVERKEELFLVPALGWKKESALALPVRA